MKYRVEVAYRGFLPHESGPSGVYRVTKNSPERAEAVVRKFGTNPDLAVMWWKIWEMREYKSG